MPITLLDLPVKPKDRDAAGGTDIIRNKYVSSRKGCKTVIGLKRHVTKWRNMWLLSAVSDAARALSAQWLVDAQPDWEKVLYFLRLPKDRQVEELKLADNDTPLTLVARAALDIFLPPASLHAELLAQHFIVGSDLGFVRLYLDPYPELENELRW